MRHRHNHMQCMQGPRGRLGMATKTSTKTKRNELTLKRKVEVIEYVKTNPGAGSRKVARVFECWKTQVQLILSHQGAILADYESTNCPDN